ncbi:hypothetical protein PSm6_08540 [Pseudomonas solani]|uniref:Uncharacterized protein n=1 Tax=Pseudomonas solani TaxID=2731552 RepID=A0ABM7L4G8_9PSED|nr:hypothetical protein PSm6_08540 [Pseudomonas solani]
MAAARGLLAAGQTLEAARLVQGLLQRPLQGRFGGGQGGRVGTQAQQCLHQALVARAQQRVAFEHGEGPGLVVPRPVAHRLAVGGQQRQPAVQLAVQFDIGVDGQLRGQAQGVGIEPGHRQLLAGTGHLLQQAAAHQQLAGAGRFHTDTGLAAGAAEQQEQAAAHGVQGHGRLVEFRAGTAGDEAVPGAAEAFFDFEVKGHGHLPPGRGLGVGSDSSHRQMRPADGCDNAKGPSQKTGPDR